MLDDVHLLLFLLLLLLHQPLVIVLFDHEPLQMDSFGLYVADLKAHAVKNSGVPEGLQHQVFLSQVDAYPPRLVVEWTLVLPVDVLL